jgi:hypothetical protein
LRLSKAAATRGALRERREDACDAKTSTEHSEHVDSQAVITRRAGMEACGQAGEHSRPVSQIADEFSVCWWTVMNAVIEHGTLLFDDPDRVGRVRQLGVDEISFLRANREHRPASKSDRD